MSTIQIIKLLIQWFHKIFLVHLMNLFFDAKIIQNPQNEMNVYIEIQKSKFLSSFDIDDSNDSLDTSKSAFIWNTNIHPDLYDKEKSQEIIKNENNEEEYAWKSRILFDSVHREDGKLVGVIMYYDLYKHGFVYYCNDSLTYPLLNALAMRYVTTFFCRDFFKDNHVFEDEIDYKTPFMNIDEDVKKPVQKKNDNRNVFAKFKNYQQIDADETIPQKTYIKNKFINNGKLYNFSFLKKPEKISNESSSYGLFSNKNLSYQEFKKSMML